MVSTGKGLELNDWMRGMQLAGDNELVIMIIKTA